MKATYYLLLVSLSLLASSCLNKDDTLSPAQISSCTGSCTIVRGRLVTAGGREGLAGATVTVNWIKYNNFLSIESRTKAKITTDNYGNYEATFLAKDDELKAGYYEVQFAIDKIKYITIGEAELSLNSVKRDTTFFMQDYLIPRKAYLNVTITNPTQVQGSYDFQASYAYATHIHYYSETVGGAAVFGDKNLPNLNPIAVAGDQPIIFSTRRVKGGVVIKTADTLFVQAGTTRNLSVTY